MADTPAVPPPQSTLLPADSAVTQEVPTTTGIRYGRFALQHLHAKGGLGEVHVAVDAELGRAVALKRMQERFGHDAAAKRRFLNEAELTATLEHPGIVPIYGLVQDETGQPCYAMRFIAGESLAEALKQWHGSERNYTALPFRQLLQRFISVCQTMAYAHSKDIIHRDLKPANIMLGPYGETLVVDWGLAKTMRQGSVPETREETEEVPSTVDFTRGSPNDHVYTQAGQVLGTIGYMSPEQAAGRVDAVGPASDLYSLGATLYELLTGQRPLRGDDIFAILQKTQAGDIPTPRQVQPAVPQALEAICQKAMTLKPENRYPSATALAADLEHWLADEPVSAYAEPWSMKARRWRRRHRTLVTGSMVALCGVVVVLGVSLVLVEQSRQEISWEKKQTDAARERGLQIFDEVFNEETIDALKRQKDLTAEQKKFLTNMVRYYQEFVHEEPKDAAGRARLARAYNRLGSGCDALGRPEEAVPAYRRALELRERLVVDFPTVPIYREALANNLNSLGVLFLEMGQRFEAETAFRRAMEFQEKLAADFPAVSGYRQDLARSLNNLGLVHENLGQRPAAETAYRRAIELREKLVADSPAERDYRQELASSFHELAGLHKIMGQRPAAETAYRRAIELREKLVTDFPTEPEYRQDLAKSLRHLGGLLDNPGQRQAAETAYRRAAELQEKLVADFPAMPRYRQDLAENFTSLCLLLNSMKQRRAAETAGRRAVELWEKLVIDSPTIPGNRHGLAASLNNLGMILQDVGQRPAAETAHRRAMELWEKLVADFPTVPHYREDLAASYVNFGHYLHDQGQADASLSWHAKAIALLEPLLQQESPLVTEQRFLRNAYWGRAEALDTLNRPNEALQDWDRALALNAVPGHEHLIRCGRALSLVRVSQHVQAVAEANVVAETKNLHVDTLYDLTRIYALASTAQEDAALQEQYATRAVELLRQAVAKGYKDVEKLKKDEDLKALRQREDYQKLLQGMEKARP